LQYVFQFTVGVGLTHILIGLRKIVRFFDTFGGLYQVTFIYAKSPYDDTHV